MKCAIDIMEYICTTKSLVLLCVNRIGYFFHLLLHSLCSLVLKTEMSQSRHFKKHCVNSSNIKTKTNVYLCMRFCLSNNFLSYANFNHSIQSFAAAYQIAFVISHLIRLISCYTNAERTYNIYTVFAPHRLRFQNYHANSKKEHEAAQQQP